LTALACPGITEQSYLKYSGFEGARLSNLPIQFIPALVIFVLFALAIWVLTIVKRMHRRGRRNPLTKDLLRNPINSGNELPTFPSNNNKKLASFTQVRYLMSNYYLTLNNTPNASRKICAPLGVSFYGGW